MSKKKIHLFFRLKDIIDGQLYGKPVLYAYTDDEELAEIFTNTRDMRIFHEEIKKVSVEEFMEFSKTYSSQRLLIGNFITKDDTLGYIRRTSLPIVVTDSEEKKTYLSLDKIYTSLSRHVFNPGILKKKYGVALQTLNFNDFYLLSQKGFLPYGDEYFAYEFQRPIQCVNDTIENIHEDSFSIFMDFYGSTMKKR